MQAQRSRRTYNEVPNKLCTPVGMVTCFLFIRFVPCLTFGRSDCQIAHLTII